jgi:hypothetical protein
LGTFSIVVFFCWLGAMGSAFAGKIDTLTLDRAWTGIVSGTLDGKSVSWYTGYSFDYTAPGISGSIHEKYSFCIDPADAILDPMAPYYIENLESVSWNTAKLHEVAYLLNEVMNDNLNPVTAQAAVWKIMFDNYNYTISSMYDLKTGKYLTSNIDALVTEAMQHQNFNLWGYYIATSPSDDPSYSFTRDYQDYVFYEKPILGGPGAPVPEPTTMLLVGSGLVGFAAFRKRFGRG